MKIIGKGSKSFSILHNKCPRCSKGDFFYSHPYHLKYFGKKHYNCSNCDLKFEREPGFFFGSMFVSYALSVALFVAWWIAKSVLFPQMPAGEMVLVMIVLQVGFAPLNLYLAKITWLNLFVKFDEGFTK